MKISLPSVIAVITLIILGIAGIFSFMRMASLRGALSGAPVASTTALAAPSLPANASSGTSGISYPASTTMVSANIGEPYNLKVGVRFTLQLAPGLHWTFSFSNPAMVRAVPGEENTYVIVAAGETDIRGTGAPICGPGKACPQFLLDFTASIVAS